ncbi:MAG: hypothetical protein OEM84_14870 [Acidimicrobiia bacterium]|nr:hypothetical protein [Acidimicrobiia bacterium]
MKVIHLGKATTAAAVAINPVRPHMTLGDDPGGGLELARFHRPVRHPHLESLIRLAPLG